MRYPITNLGEAGRRLGQDAEWCRQREAQHYENMQQRARAAGEIAKARAAGDHESADFWAKAWDSLNNQINYYNQQCLQPRSMPSSTYPEFGPAPYGNVTPSTYESYANVRMTPTELLQPLRFSNIPMAESITGMTASGAVGTTPEGPLPPPRPPTPTSTTSPKPIEPPPPVPSVDTGGVTGHEPVGPVGQADVPSVDCSHLGPNAFFDGRQCRSANMTAAAGGFGNLMNIASMAPAATAASGISLMGRRYPVVNL